MKPLWWFFGSVNLPSDKRKPIKFEICSLFGSWNKLTNFWWAALESSLQVSPKHSTTLQCHKMKLLWSFFATANLPFRLKKAIKFEIWNPFACSREIYQFFGVLFGNLLSGLAQEFHDPSVSQHDTPMKVLWLSQSNLQTKESNKISNFDPICLLKRNCPIFRWLIWKAAFSFGIMFAWPFSVKKWNPSDRFLVQSTYLQRKENQ